MITVAYLRLVGEDVRCIRCGTHYRCVRPLNGPRAGESLVHCPRCERELVAAPAWADTAARTLLGAGLLAAVAASWLVVLL